MPTAQNLILTAKILVLSLCLRDRKLTWEAPCVLAQGEHISKSGTAKLQNYMVISASLMRDTGIDMR
uniref:Uncharacterized protein n=1 Tax=Rhizophora mucronata TaxID=61149 RepID=A0A2P2IUG4_RHIMU